MVFSFLIKDQNIVIISVVDVVDNGR